MRRQLSSGFGRYEYVAVRVAEILSAGIRAADTILMAQLQNADRNRGLGNRRKDKPAGSSQRSDSLQRHLYQTVAIDQIRSEERRVGKECRSRWSTYD